MGFIDEIKAKAKADKKTIILPESMDTRTWEAAEKILKEGLANLIILGSPEEVEKYGKGYDVTGATIIDPATYEKTEEYLDLFVELRKKKDVDRFRTPRGEFTRYINSGGRDSSLGRKSVSNYIRNSLGGSSNATQRMGAARSSSARLLNVAGVFASGGARAVEQYLSIENLSHKTASDAFIAITDFICPDGGPQDEGIARSAYISAIEESPEIATIKFEDLTSEQIMVIVERTMANAIFNRITNDIGNKIILLPQERAISDRLIVQMKDFVKGSVSDAVINLDIKAGNIRQGDSLRIVDRVYKAAFEIMVSAGENE